MEHFFHCPYCLQKISMLLDLSSNIQEYIEDCEVCCQGIHISYHSSNEEVKDFRVLRLDSV
ncbi:MAG: CPXCG motif-containing cysteine-rich protein [Nitrospinota bacterium]|nr:CPXCG motif-containing cysteine-rich protein [Nitrospinota bacterium]